MDEVMNGGENEPATRGELRVVRGHIKDKMVTRDEFLSRMDGFTGRVDDSDYSSAKNSARLNDHAKSISALEEKFS